MPTYPNSIHKEESKEQEALKGLRMETPKEVASRYGCSPSTLAIRLRRCTIEFPARYGPTGRILELNVTSELDAWFRKLAGQ